MFRIYKTNFLTAVTVLIFLTAAHGLAFGTPITIDSRDDAGLYPTEAAYLQLNVLYEEGEDVTYTGGPAFDPLWISYNEVWEYYDSNYSITSGWDDWELQSAGNIWSSDKTVGDFITTSAAGTYRITPISGGFYYTYGENAEDWRWELQITWANGSEMIGFNDYLDIDLAEGDWVYFWIWDTNSIDNSGSLTADISPIPEPSTILLLGMGLALLGFLYRSAERHCSVR